MITIFLLAGLLLLLHRATATPEAIAIEERVEASRDEHLKLMFRSGVHTHGLR
jgi:hypothetical protein